MKSPSCEWATERLTWFVGGDLGREEAEVVADHLARCPACRREAADLQQARKALVALADGAATGSVPGVDDEMFARLHRDTMAAVERQAMTGPRRGPSQLPLAARILWAAAAGLLFWLGWWSVTEPPSTSLLDRDPIPLATGAANGGAEDGRSHDGGAEVVVPWAGPRAVLRPLGHTESWSGELEVEEPTGSGMMGRWQLRRLERFDGPLDPMLDAPEPDEPDEPDESDESGARGPRSRR